VAAGVAAGSPVGLLATRTYRRRLWGDLVSRWSGENALTLWTIAGLALGVAGLFGLWRVAARVIFVSESGIYTGVSHNIGDLPFHLTATNRFLYGDNFPPQHPSFAGVAFTYPFLTDFIGAMLVGTGMAVDDMIVWSTFALCAALAVALFHWTREITGDRVAAVLAPPIAFFSGGFGWTRFISEAQTREGGVWALLARLPHDYTITFDNEFRWGNLVTSLLITQRGLLLGLPLAIVVFGLWWNAAHEEAQDDRTGKARMIAAGVIAGMLPLIHAHTYAVLLAVAACQVALSTNRWMWLPFFTWSLALGLPQVWWVTQAAGVQGKSFVGWSVGWDRGDQNVVLFWLRNAGLFIPVLLYAVLGRRQHQRIVPRPLLLFYLPFTLCFVVPNLFRLAPWIWDNVKVLVYWFIASVPLVSLGLAHACRGRGWRPIAGATVFASLVFAGSLDLWRVASKGFESRVFDRSGIAFAEAVKLKTGPDSLILHRPMPNHAIALTGRQSLMGYSGHVWSHGLDPGPREADITRMYSGRAEADALLAKYRIDYVVIGPEERAHLHADEAQFAGRPLAVEVDGYRLYQISSVH
jgi:hypothetical protein